MMPRDQESCTNAGGRRCLVGRADDISSNGSEHGGLASEYLFDLAGSDRIERIEHLWHQRQEVFDSIGMSRDHDHSDARQSDVLLVLKVAIARQQDMETGRSRPPHQFAIAESGPALLDDGSQLVAGQPRRELTR